MAESVANDVLESLEAAHDDYQAVTADIESIGRDDLEELAEHIKQIDRLIEQFEDRATGTGDFGGYIAFRQQITTLVENASEDLPHRDALETVADIADQRRLSEQDFQDIRDTLADVRPTVDLLDAEEAARLAYRDARRAVGSRIDDLEEQLAHVAHLQSLANVDLDAPVEEIRDPINTYNRSVGSAFGSFYHDTPAAEVLNLFALTNRYPLVPMEAPPQRLNSYLEDHPEALTVPDLLEYADYSTSKLDHYVQDPAALKTAVATDRTYLERLSADPFQIDWPPPPATVMRWLSRELVSVVGRFADETCLSHLHDVRDCARNTDRFDHLREVAVARATLDEAERQRIQSGAVEEEREDLRDRREQLETALESYPTP